MNKWECTVCGHIGYPTIIHNDEKCEVCYSGKIVEISTSSTENLDPRLQIISNELLSAVLGYKAYFIDPKFIKWNTNRREDDLVYEKTNEIQYCISIHNLAHKCKEWVLTRGYFLESGLPYKTRATSVLFNDSFGGFIEGFDATTEPGAIFKACQWVLDSKG